VKKEVENHLPVMLETAEILKNQYPMVQFIVIKAPTIDTAMIHSFFKNSSFTCPVVENETYNGINACDICIVSSGTATLETAILQKPMVVIYKTSFITWLLAKLFIKIPNIGLVNIVADKRIVPECMQFQATAETIANHVKSIFLDELKISEIKSELRKVKESLGDPGASQRAAEEVLKIVNSG